MLPRHLSQAQTELPVANDCDTVDVKRSSADAATI
jgi:hypothetical protein